MRLPTANQFLQLFMRQSFDVSEAAGAFSTKPTQNVPTGYAKALADQQLKKENAS